MSDLPFIAGSVFLYSLFGGVWSVAESPSALSSSTERRGRTKDERLAPVLLGQRALDKLVDGGKCIPRREHSLQLTPIREANPDPRLRTHQLPVLPQDHANAPAATSPPSPPSSYSPPSPSAPLSTTAHRLAAPSSAPAPRTPSAAPMPWEQSTTRGGRGSRVGRTSRRGRSTWRGSRASSGQRKRWR